jgi:threonylcarbamoyladenosine tRNA methylthiotransferase MtaB
MKRHTVLFATLGCKVNQYDSGAMLDIFKSKGFAPWRGRASAADTGADGASYAGPEDGAPYAGADGAAYANDSCGAASAEICGGPDVVVVNTCIVTAESERKSRQAIRRFRSKYPGALLAVIGCYPQMYPQTVADIGGVDYISGVAGHAELAGEIVERLSANEVGARPPGGEPSTDTRTGGPPQKADPPGEGPTRLPWERVRAYVKIQEGCDNFCGYCIVPYVRGIPRSRAMPEVLDEIDAVLGRGAPEIVITGTQISAYTDGAADLGRLVSEVSKRLSCRENLPVRLRLSSLEPASVTREFVRVLSACGEVVCPHFHLSLQSGSASVLKRMGRRYSPERFLEAVSFLRDAFPDAGITTDIIAGYPGETDYEFTESYNLCRMIAFSKMHVFPYSARRGTRAAETEWQVGPGIKNERAAKLSELSNAMSLAFHTVHIGKKVGVLVEKSIDGALEGLTGNYIRVRAKPAPGTVIPSPPRAGARAYSTPDRGLFAEVLVTSADASYIYGDTVIM